MTMKSVAKISGAQLTLLLLSGRLSGCLLFSSDQFSGFSFRDCILSMLLNGAFLFLLFIPTWWVLRNGEKGITERAYQQSSAFGKTVDGLYMGLCLFVMGLDIVQFSDFASKTMRGDFSVFILTVVFIITCLFAALYGIQALARASTLVAVFSIICLLVFSVALFSKMRWINFSPENIAGSADVFKKALIDLPRTAEVTAIGLLYPHVKGSRIGALGVFAGLTAFFSAVVSTSAVAVLGDFAAMTFYPYYTAVTAAQIGVFQRLDILVTAIWLGTFFVRFTLFFMLFLERSRSLFGKRSALTAAVIGLGLLTAAALLIQNGSYNGEWHLATQIYWWVLGTFCFLLPAALWIGGKRREAR